jgi:transcriptional regulator with XRE-family HTH domain
MPEPAALPHGLPPHPLRQYRDRHNLRLSDLAARVGMSAAGLSRIEGGATELPGCLAIMAFAAATKYEVGELDIFRWHFEFATGREPVAGTKPMRGARAAAAPPPPPPQKAASPPA